MTDPTGNPLSPFAKLIGFEFGPARPGAAEVYLTLRDDHMNFSGVGHGALVMALMDTACGIALTADETGTRTRRVVTVSFTTGYLAPVFRGRLTATARILGGGQRLKTCLSEVHDAAGKRVAAGQGVFQYLRDKPSGGHTDP